MKTSIVLLFACFFIGSLSPVMAAGTVIYDVTAPDGTIYEVEAPDDASEQDLISAVARQRSKDRIAKIRAQSEKSVLLTAKRNNSNKKTSVPQ